MSRVAGSQLQVGDTIEVWWQPGQDTITVMSAYRGPLAHLFANGAQIAGFALLGVGMTIDNDARYTLIIRAAPDGGGQP